jgi:hypothetical protein
MNVPVILVIFNRPDHTRSVARQILHADPEHLLVIADGPRNGHPDDVANCRAARSVIEETPWRCKVTRSYSDVNLGCAARISSGLTWAFQIVEEAIILEDDCLPDNSFFRYAAELLEWYRTDERVLAVSGNNFLSGRFKTPYSYYFSRYPHCWGWATWRRAWALYDHQMSLWPLIRDDHWLERLLPRKRDAFYWRERFEAAFTGTLDSWAARWVLGSWIHNGLTILPSVNLVSNIGFGTDATHTREHSSLLSVPMASMSFPLAHPPFMIRDTIADDYTQDTLFADARTLTRLRAVLAGALKGT